MAYVKITPTTHRGTGAARFFAQNAGSLRQRGLSSGKILPALAGSNLRCGDSGVSVISGPDQKVGRQFAQSGDQRVAFLLCAGRGPAGRAGGARVAPSPDGGSTATGFCHQRTGAAFHGWLHPSGPAGVSDDGVWGGAAAERSLPPQGRTYSGRAPADSGGARQGQEGSVYLTVAATA